MLTVHRELNHPIVQRLIASADVHDKQNKDRDNTNHQRNEENAKRCHSLLRLGLFGVNVLLESFQHRKVIQRSILAVNAHRVRHLWINIGHFVRCIHRLTYYAQSVLCKLGRSPCKYVPVGDFLIPELLHGIKDSNNFCISVGKNETRVCFLIFQRVGK